MALRKVRPSRPVPRDYPLKQKFTGQNPKPHPVKDGESFETLAESYRIPKWRLMQFNYATTELKYVNWYLYNYVGCRNKSPDGKTYVFTSQDKNQKGGNGYIVIPMIQQGPERPPITVRRKSMPSLANANCDLCKKKEKSSVFCMTPAGIKKVDRELRNTAFTGGGGSDYVGSIKRGMLFKYTDGDRIVLGADSMRVYYMMNNKAYQQDAWSFKDEIMMDALGEAGKSAVVMVYLAQFEMAIIMGFVSVGSIGGFLLVTSINILEATRDPEMKRQANNFKAVVVATVALKYEAPELYDKVVSMNNLLSVAVEVAKRLPSSFLDLKPKDYGQLVGGLIGKLGANATKKTIIIIVKICLSVLIFIATKLVPKAGELTIEEIKKRVQETIKFLKQYKINIDELSAKKIVNEVDSNYDKIVKIMEKLQADTK